MQDGEYLNSAYKIGSVPSLAEFFYQNRSTHSFAFWHDKRISVFSKRNTSDCKKQFIWDKHMYTCVPLQIDCCRRLLTCLYKYLKSLFVKNLLGAGKDWVSVIYNFLKLLGCTDRVICPTILWPNVQFKV